MRVDTTKTRLGLASVVLALVFSSLASAGDAIDFQVQSFGPYFEDGNKLFIETDVVEQDPNLGFVAIGGVFEVDEFGNPPTFAGILTVAGDDGDLTVVTAGFGEFEDGFVGLVGGFAIDSGTGIFEGASGSGIFSAIGAGGDAGVITVNLVGVIEGAQKSIGACCFNDGSCEELESQECFQQDGFFEGVGTTCGDVECPVVGACCLPNGNCTVISELECIKSGGEFQGVDVSCNDVECEVITAGACCLPDEVCEEMEEQACADAGGLFYGGGSTCDEVTCAAGIGDFVVTAVGVFKEDVNGILITAQVTEQTPDLGLEDFVAGLLVEQVEEVEVFSGDVELSEPDGGIFGETAGFGFNDGALTVLVGTIDFTSGKGPFEGLTGTGVWTAYLEGGGDDVALIQVSGNLQVEKKEPCPADLNGDGVVGSNDLIALLGAWGDRADGPPDFDGDGVVGSADLIFLLGAWGPCK